MAKVVMTAAHVTLGGTDYDAQIKNVMLDRTADAVETSDFNSGGNREYLGGMKTGTFSFDAEYDDLSTLQAYINTNLGVVVAVTLQEIEATLAATAPEYQFNVLITQEKFGAAVGAVHGHSFSWQVTGAVTRDITP